MHDWPRISYENTFCYTIHHIFYSYFRIQAFNQHTLKKKRKKEICGLLAGSQLPGSASPQGFPKPGPAFILLPFRAHTAIKASESGSPAISLSRRAQCGPAGLQPRTAPAHLLSQGRSRPQAQSHSTCLERDGFLHCFYLNF